MDKSTAGGLGGGWALVALAIILGGVGFGPYIDIPSVVIVLGGTVASVVVSFSLVIPDKYANACSSKTM